MNLQFCGNRKTTDQSKNKMLKRAKYQVVIRALETKKTGKADRRVLEYKWSCKVSRSLFQGAKI